MSAMIVVQQSAASNQIPLTTLTENSSTDTFDKARVLGQNQQPTAIQSEIRVTLTDNPILIFEPLEVKDGKLLGRSSIYDKVSGACR